MPPLTTIATAPRSLGRRAAERILARMRDPALAIGPHVEPVHLVVRESTCPPPAPDGRRHD